MKCRRFPRTLRSKQVSKQNKFFSSIGALPVFTNIVITNNFIDDDDSEADNNDDSNNYIDDDDIDK